MDDKKVGRGANARLSESICTWILGYGPKARKWVPSSISNFPFSNFECPQLPLFFGKSLSHCIFAHTHTHTCLCVKSYILCEFVYLYNVTNTVIIHYYTYKYAYINVFYMCVYACMYVCQILVCVFMSMLMFMSMTSICWDLFWCPTTLVGTLMPYFLNVLRVVNIHCLAFKFPCACSKKEGECLVTHAWVVIKLFSFPLTCNPFIC